MRDSPAGKETIVPRAGLAFVLMLLVACGSSVDPPDPSPSPQTHVLRGTFDATGDCIAERAGYPITVTDGDGNVIATGATLPDTGGRDGQCLSRFGVEVPDAEFYSIQIGAHEGPTYSRSDLEAENWILALDLT